MHLIQNTQNNRIDAKAATKPTEGSFVNNL